MLLIIYERILICAALGLVVGCFSSIALSLLTVFLIRSLNNVLMLYLLLFVIYINFISKMLTRNWFLIRSFPCFNYQMFTIQITPKCNGWRMLSACGCTFDHRSYPKKLFSKRLSQFITHFLIQPFVHDRPHRIITSICSARIKFNCKQ